MNKIIKQIKLILILLKLIIKEVWKTNKEVVIFLILVIALTIPTVKGLEKLYNNYFKDKIELILNKNNEVDNYR